MSTSFSVSGNVLTRFFIKCHLYFFIFFQYCFEENCDKMSISFFSVSCTVLKTSVIKCQQHLYSLFSTVLKRIMIKCQHLFSVYSTVLKRNVIKCPHHYSVLY